MKLKVFSDEEVLGSFVDRLHALMKLDNQKIGLVVKQMVEFAREHELSDAGFKLLQKELSVDTRTLNGFLSVSSRLVTRILSGRNQPDVQKDLVAQGFPQDKVEFVFSTVDGLPQSEKDSLRIWGLESETLTHRNHLHAAYAETEFKSIIDNGFLIGIVPVSMIQLRVRTRDDAEEQIWTFEPSSHELDYLIKILESARQELDSATKDLKKRIGGLVVTTRA